MFIRPRYPRSIPRIRYRPFAKKTVQAPQDEALAQDVQETSYVPEPEDFEPTPQKPKGPLNRFPSKSHAKTALLFYLFFLLMSFVFWDTTFRDQLWLTKRSILEDHEYWRLFTAVMIHANLAHFLSNGPLFLIFGWFLRAFFGRLAFPVVSFLIGALANLVTIYFYDLDVQLLGASGMVYAMVAMWLVLYIRFDVDYSILVRSMRAIGFSLIIMFPTTFQPNTSYLSHAAGFILGLIVAVLMLPFVKVSA